MRNLIAIMKRRTSKESAQTKIASLLEEFIDVYNRYPNFQHNQEDWQKHYNVATEIVQVYNEHAVELNAMKVSTVVFLGTVRDHISRLEEIRDYRNM